jgi:hypothetical protein
LAKCRSNAKLLIDYGSFWYYFCDEGGKYVRNLATINNRKYDFSKIAVIKSEDLK